MRIDHAGSEAKGWYFGPWKSSFGISVGFANQGIDEPHVHSEVTEIYLVARGSARVRVGQNTVSVREGDVLTVEPGEGHTFLENSSDYFHFVVQSPGLQGDGAVTEKGALLHAELRHRCP